MPIIVLIILSLSGGLAYASKSAIPGDALYNVKISATEPLEEALAFGPKAISAVHVSHALERLHEIEQLKNSGKLNRGNQVFTKFAFENEVSKVNADIESLNKINDFNDARALEKTLSENLKKSTALAALYEPLPAEKKAQDLVPATPEAPTTPVVKTPSAPQLVTAPVVSTPKAVPLVTPVTVQPTTTTYVPKLLPPRANIPRGDDGYEDD